ncbi:MAG: head-tail connector protein [Clostridia bacterium]
MPTLEEVKLFLRVDGSDENELVASLILTAKELVEAVLLKPITCFVAFPETITQAMLIVVATLYEERQVTKNDKNTLDFGLTLDLVRRMLFAYRESAF